MAAMDKAQKTKLIASVAAILISVTFLLWYQGLLGGGVDTSPAAVKDALAPEPTPEQAKEYQQIEEEMQEEVKAGRVQKMGS